ncbi:MULTISPECIES: RNA polymerase sigma factor [Anaerostipes]|uniref:RNA polymerase n=1 Tax=Anaerostipes butyraticus TaxID=645466 RepID=A0A916Q4P1_9FIRM|nr:MULTISPECIES: sigma-70 family RNA polymerase sigma factor [Anaerostipes]GFO84349.1 RNA polymerase [Anaerostipes butyraticus]
MRKKKEEYFQKLYEETYDELLRYVSKLYWYDAAMVEDILQETYLILYRKITEVMRHENPTGWIKMTAKYVTYHVLERNHAVEEILSQYQADTAVSPEKLLDEYEDLRKFLTEKELKLIRRYYEEGYSLDELAQEYRISKPALKMRIHRVVKKIRRGIAVCLIFS